ncbi:DUF4084 domain-containing protein [Domibacillus robiginosus]|uniref:DUF4084 domain-containing protein n=1 Tax=Domibacillus robiginosus TaxID=1071054 RepID=UPI00067C19B0|nr:DUF4084 domain-containing protein [Domibacillus robiginosus]
MNKRYLVFILFITAIYYVWLFSFENDDWAKTLGGNVLSIVAPGIAGYWLLRALLANAMKQPLFWKLIFTGLSFYFLSECLWFWYETILGQEIPIAGFLDFFYVAQAFCYILALVVRFKQEHKAAQTVRMVFDMLITMTVAVSFIWHFIIRNMVGELEASLFDLLVNLCYPVSDIGMLLAAATFFFGLNESHAKKEMGLILLGLLVQITADILYLSMIFHNGYESGNITDPMYILSTLLIALAGHLYGGAPSESHTMSKQMGIVRFSLPYIGVIVLFAFMLFYSGFNALTIGASISIVLLMIRQAVTLVENQRLYDQLLQRSRELSANEQRYRSLFDYYPEAAFSIELDGCFQSVNQAAANLLGFSNEKDVIGLHSKSFIASKDQKKVLEHFSFLLKGSARQYEMTLCSRTGDELIMSITNIPIIVDGKVIGIYGIGKDVTDQKKQHRKMTHMAYHDALTGLPNRLFFNQKIASLVLEKEKAFAVLYMDLDGFKAINDTLGHDAGDALLVSVSKRLSASLRSSDMAARQGGDEFTALVSGFTDREEVERIAERLLRSVSKPYYIDGRKLVVTPSIGIALYPQDGEDVDELLKKADAAMYEVKQSGKGAYQFYMNKKGEPLHETTLGFRRNDF